MALRQPSLPDEDKADIGQIRDQEALNTSRAGNSTAGGASSSTGTGGAGWRFNKHGDDEDGDTGSKPKSGKVNNTSGTDNFKSDLPSTLKDQEEAPETGEDRVGKGYSASNNTGKLRGRVHLTKRQAATGGGIVGLIVAGVFGASVVQGPFEFIHFANWLEKIHLSSNEDFGDDRTSKVLVYALLGKTERGRLGITANKAADKWEKRLVNEFGLKPVYTTTTGRFAGLGVVEAHDGRGLDKNGKAVKMLEGLQQEGRVVVRTGNNTGGRQAVKTTEGIRLGARDIYIDFRGPSGEKGLSSKEIRQLIREVSKETRTFRITGSVSSRLLIKRGGVPFHFFTGEKFSQKIDAAADRREEAKRREDYEKNVLKRWAKTVKNGVSRDKRTQTDEDGNDKDGDTDTTASGREASEEANRAADELSRAGENGEDTKALRQSLVKRAGGGAAIAVGVFCAVKDIGNGVDDYKYANNLLPMMRMGWGVINMGNHVMAGSVDGNEFSLDEMRAMKTRFTDPDTGSSWTDAKSVRAEMGKSGGVPMPEEAQLSRIADKPDVFALVDKVASTVPGLGLTCDLFSGISNLPIIRDVGNLATGAIDAALSPFGTNTTELTEKGLSVIAGEGVNPLAKGAEFGNLANTGAFLAANDQAIATGGTALTNTEVAELNDYQNQLDADTRAHKSVFARYFDPYDYGSVTGKAIDTLPNNTAQLANMINPVSIFGNVGQLFTPKVKAATKYNYGVSKYGFSLADQQDDRFEDPYENALAVEPHLSELNDKYGKCFGITVDDQGVLHNDKTVNVLKLEKDDDYKDCRRGTHLTSNTETNRPKGLSGLAASLNPFASPKASAATSSAPETEDDVMFKRYRFYLADTVTAKALDCYEADNSAACEELGAGSGQTESESSGGEEAAGDSVKVEDLGKSSDKINCAAGTKDLGVVTSKYTGAFKKESGPMKIRLCQITDIPGRGNDTNGNSINGGAVVEARVSGAWEALAKKAKADGINLTSSSSFRLADSCGGNGDGIQCAKPGGSAHQTGWAIDFNNMGDFVARGRPDSCAGRMTWNSPEWRWMRDNAEDFGIKQYSAESWHWDFIPESNRCGK